VRQGFTALLLLVALSGMITVPAIDVPLLLLALIGGPLLAQVVLRLPGVEPALGLVPVPVRFLLAFLLTFLLARPIAGVWFEWHIQWGSEFMPVVLSTAIGVVVFSVLLGARREGLLPRRPPSGTRWYSSASSWCWRCCSAGMPGLALAMPSARHARTGAGRQL
jgi:hypothetical protein